MNKNIIIITFITLTLGMAGLCGYAAWLNDEIQTVTGKWWKTYEQMEAGKKRIKALEADLARARAEVEELETELTAAHRLMEETGGKVAQLKSVYSQQVDDLKAQLSSMELAKNEAESSVAYMQANRPEPEKVYVKVPPEYYPVYVSSPAPSFPDHITVEHRSDRYRDPFGALRARSEYADREAYWLLENCR